MSVLGENAFADATARIASWKRPLLVSHVKPDGDALGSLVAMRSFLRSRDVTALALLFEAIPARYTVFSRYETMPVFGCGVTEADLTDCDGVLILDTCTYKQLTPIRDWLRHAAVEKMAVDHHVTRDELADHYLVDETAPATCVILYDWARASGWSITPEAGEALFIGTAMDTGWFRHSNTDRRVLSLAADLVARGTSPYDLYQQLYQRETPARIRLLGAALCTLELVAGGRAAVMRLTRRALADCKATTADTEDIVNEPLRIGAVMVSVLLVEEENGVVRASFRSKPPGRSGPQTGPVMSDIDVSEMARTFGGGGHRRAAGARTNGILVDVHRAIVNRLELACSSSSSPQPPAATGSRDGEATRA